MYYKKDNKKDRKGEIALRTIREVKLFDEYKTKKYVFAIITTTGRTYFIQGSDDENAISWVNAILTVIGKEPLTKEAAKASAVANAAAVATFNSNISNSNPTPSQSLGSGAGNGDSDSSEETPQKKVSLDDFVQIKVVGRGGFGKVLLVKKKDTGKVYAMKVLKKDVVAARGEVEHTRTEKSVMSKLDHPFLAKLYWSFQTGEKLYFIMDFINGGELFFHLSREKKFTEDRTRFYSAEIISGVEYLHKAGVIYRDLKPENLLLNAQGHIIMTDFGLSKEGLIDKNSTTTTFCGTPEYLAPEIIQGKDYTKAIDWWSVGTLIFEMLTGLPPFYSDDEENMYRKIMTGELTFPPGLSNEVKDIVSKFLIRDPEKRLQNAEDIRSHPWFKNLDWAKLESLQITPPFKPDVKSVDDLAYFDGEFLDEDVNDEDDEVDGTTKGAAHKDAFHGFTYAAPDAH